MENSTREEPADGRYLVRSVARAAEVLDVLATSGPGVGLSVTEVAAAAGMSKSAAFATLYTLGQYGLAADDGEGMNRRYRLGMGLVRLGSTARRQIALQDVARPYLIALTKETRLTSRLAVPEGDAAVVIDQESLGAAHRFELQMGMRELPHCSGLGKAILSQVDDAEVIEILARSGMPRRTPHTITSAREMLLHLAQIRELGYAIDDEEDAEGIFCIGSAVLDADGACVAAISITGLKLEQTTEDLSTLGDRVHDCAKKISGALGYRTPPATDAP